MRHHRFKPQSEVLLHKDFKCRRRYSVRTISINQHAYWMCGAIVIGDLHTASRGELGSHDGLGNSSCHIGTCPVHLDNLALLEAVGHLKHVGDSPVESPSQTNNHRHGMPSRHMCRPRSYDQSDRQICRKVIFLSCQKAVSVSFVRRSRMFATLTLTR